MYSRFFQVFRTNTYFEFCCRWPVITLITFDVRYFDVLNFMLILLMVLLAS